MRLFAEGYRRLSRKKGVVVLQQYVPAQPAQPSTLRTDILWHSVGSITGSASIYVPVQLNPPDTAITWMRIENPVVGAVGEGYVFVNGYKVILTKVNEGSINEYWGYPVYVTSGHPAIPAKPAIPEIAVLARMADWRFFGHIDTQMLYGDGGLSFSVPSASGVVLVGLTTQTDQISSAKTASEVVLRFNEGTVAVLRGMNGLSGFSWTFQPTDRFAVYRRGNRLAIQHMNAAGDVIRSTLIPGSAPTGPIRPYAALFASGDAIAYTQVITESDLILDDGVPAQGSSVFFMDDGVVASPRATFVLGAFSSRFDIRMEGSVSGALELNTSFLVPASPRALLVIGGNPRFYVAGEIEASVTGAFSPVTDDPSLTNAWFGPVAPIRMRVSEVGFSARPTPIRTSVDFSAAVSTTSNTLPRMKDPLASLQPALEVSFVANDDSLWRFWFGNDPTTFVSAPVFIVEATVAFQPIHVDFSVGVSSEVGTADSAGYMSCVTVNTATYAVTHYSDIHIAGVIPPSEGGKQWFLLHDRYGRGFFRLEWGEEPPYDVISPGSAGVTPVPAPFDAAVDFGASDFGSSTRKNVDSMWVSIVPIKELEYEEYLYDVESQGYVLRATHEPFSTYNVTATTYDESQNPTPLVYPVTYYDPTSRAIFGRGVFTKEWGVRLDFFELRCGFALDFVELSINNGAARRSYG